MSAVNPFQVVEAEGTPGSGDGPPDITFPVLEDAPLPPLPPEFAAVVATTTEEAERRRTAAEFDADHRRKGDYDPPPSRSAALRVEEAAAACSISPAVLCEFVRRCGLAGLEPGDVVGAAFTRAIAKLPRNEREGAAYRAKHAPKIPSPRRQWACDFDSRETDLFVR